MARGEIMGRREMRREIRERRDEILEEMRLGKGRRETLRLSKARFSGFLSRHYLIDRGTKACMGGAVPTLPGTRAPT
jgi:hypothetical protein